MKSSETLALCISGRGLLVHEEPGCRIFSGCLDADTAVKYGNKYGGNAKTKNP